MPITTSGPSRESPKLGKGFSSLHHTTQRLLGSTKKSVTSPEGFDQSLERLMQWDPSTRDGERDNLSHNYKDLHRVYTDLYEEEVLIKRMERNAQIRNTFFRFLSTLVIGVAVLIIYATAKELEIPMPLLPIRL